MQLRSNPSVKMYQTAISICYKRARGQYDFVLIFNCLLTQIRTIDHSIFRILLY